MLEFYNSISSSAPVSGLLQPEDYSASPGLELILVEEYLPVFGCWLC